MAAVIQKSDVGVQEFGRDIVVPDNPKAKLMYYFDSMCSVLDLSGLAGNRQLSKLRKYRRHADLNDQETKSLVELCQVLSPDKLNGKVIFQDDAMCGYNDNSFFKISAVQHNLVVSDQIIIGGRTCSVKKIMAYKISWLKWCFTDPMKYFSDQNSSCVIL